MNISRKQYIILFLAFISFILFVTIFKWIDYLSNNNYIVEVNEINELNRNILEGFVQPNVDTGSPLTSHTVNLPLNTTYSCKNFCGPTARCSITGQQCSTDIDCPGCQPYVPPLKKNPESIPGENDAGKLTWGVTPQFSTLTTDIGTQAKLITNSKFAKPPSPNFGVDIWTSAFNEETKLFDERYKPNRLQFMPDYPKRYSLSGNFMEDGPLASNSYFS